MKLKVFENMEEHAFYILLLSVLAGLWWVAVWTLTDDALESIQVKYKISKRVQCWFIIAFIILVIYIHPEMLYKI